VAVVFGAGASQKDIGVGAAMGGPLALATVAYGVGDLAKQGWNALFTGRFQYDSRVKAIDQKLYARANNIDGASFPTSFRANPGENVFGLPKRRPAGSSNPRGRLGPGRE